MTSMNGSDVLDVLDEIAATSGRSEKERLLVKHIDDPLMQRVLVAAYDPFVTYGVTPPKAKADGKQTITLESKVWLVLDMLASREVTGNHAKRLIQEWLVEVLDEKSSALLFRILSKDLRCGITAKTINKVKSGLIPVFETMLAHKFEPHRIKSWPVAVEPKLDGLRTIVVAKGEKVEFFSRSGKTFDSLEHLSSAVLNVLHDARARAQNAESFGEDVEELRQLYWGMLGGDEGPSFVLDAEAVSGSFNETTGAIRRKEEAATDAVLNVFEVLSYDAFVNDGAYGKDWFYKDRRDFAEYVVKGGARSSSIRLVPRYLVSSHEEIQRYYQAFRDRKLEGAIVKPMNGLYRKKRSHDWMKIKAQESLDLRVTGAFEGTGKYEGMLGGLIVDNEGVSVRVGGGFADADRETLWAAFQRDQEVAHWPSPGPNPEVLGRLIEVEYHEQTPDGSLRHPRFVRFRDDKDDLLSAA